MTLHVYGASDDLIELRGDIEEEFVLLDDDEKTYIALSNGVVLSIRYDGEWEVRQVGGAVDLVKIIPPRGEDAGDDEYGCPGYSDRAVVEPEPGRTIDWVVYGKDIAR